jgi:hypothetical protein
MRGFVAPLGESVQSSAVVSSEMVIVLEQIRQTGMRPCFLIPCTGCHPRRQGWPSLASDDERALVSVRS